VKYDKRVTIAKRVDQSFAPAGVLCSPTVHALDIDQETHLSTQSVKSAFKTN